MTFTIAKIFEKLNATKASGSENSATHILESQLNEKNKVIERLNKEISECKRTAQEDLVKLVSEHECQIKSLQSDHQRLLSEKVKCEMENERLDLVLQNIESANSDMKSMHEARRNEKDKTIESLQNRIQNYLYDADGEPWQKKYKTIEDSQMKQWSDSAYNAPPHTPYKNDVVIKTNDTERLEATAYPRPQDNKFTSRRDQGHNLLR